MTVPVPVDRAFSAFADLAQWWPREYTWAADTLEDIGPPDPAGTGPPNPLL